MQSQLLVIEDAQVHLSILRKIAAQAGFATTGVDSFTAAEQVLRRRSFDCITLDLNLGDRSGHDVLQMLSDLRCRAPILIISAEEPRVRDIASRAARILGLKMIPPFAKPVDIPRLRDTLKEIAADAGRQRQITRAAAL